MEGVGNKEECHHENDKASHFILARVAAIKLLLAGFGVKDVQVPHEDREDVRDSYARENAHDRGQNQHKTNHHTLDKEGEGRSSKKRLVGSLVHLCTVYNLLQHKCCTHNIGIAEQARFSAMVM